jgi:hypothetical protein
MPVTFPEAFAPVAGLVGIRCLVQTPGDDRGAAEAIVFDWSTLSADARGELIVDFLGDAFVSPHGDADYLELPVDGLSPPRWRAADLIPFAFVGPPGLAERGARWELAGPVDAVLFLDLASGTPDACPVLAWQGGPTPDLVPLVPSVTALGLRAARPSE